MDYIRTLLLLAVISLHTASSYIFSESRYSVFGMNLAFLVNQAARFSVPGFFVLSGTALGLGKAHESAGHFYANRLKKIIVPYLVWYIVYFACNNRGSGFLTWDFAEFFRGILSGSSALHLYFIVVIAQLYLLYPQLHRLKYPTVIIAFAVGLAFQTLSYLAAG